MKGRILMAVGEALLALAGRCLEAAHRDPSRRGVWLRQMQAVEQRHTRLELDRIGNVLHIRSCGRHMRVNVGWGTRCKRKPA